MLLLLIFIVSGAPILYFIFNDPKCLDFEKIRETYPDTAALSDNDIIQL